MSSASVGGRKVPASERVLAAASRLFYAEGIRAVGVEAVASEAGVTKKTLYDNFGSKDALIAAYLRGRDERWRAWIMEVAEREGGSPEDRILATFDALGEWMEHENVRGCGFVNASVELADPGHPGRVVVREQKEWMHGYLAGLAKEAGVDDVDGLAERLMLLHEGASVANSLDLARDAALTARKIALTLITEARPGS
ncbi:MAG: TetR/AcrR family transcriptional regulator [Rubrobacter sp.]